MVTSADWLATQNETGQTPKQFKLGGPNITWMKDGLELDAYAGYEHVSLTNIFEVFLL